jgi:hypothetical protein
VDARATEPPSTGAQGHLPPRLRSYWLASRKELNRLSFYDEADEPRGPRRARRPPGRGGAGRPPGDHQQVIVRRWIALGAGLLLLILIILGVKSCVNNQAKQALKDYNQKVSAIIQESDSKVARPLFAQLTGATGRNQSPADAQQSVNDIRAEADNELARASAISAPDEVKEAQRELLLALTLRRDGVAGIAQQLQPALASSGTRAVAAIAGEMRRFDASDVLYTQRVAPLIARALKAKGITVGPGGETIAASHFLPDVGWLDSGFVGSQLGGSAPAGGRHGKPAPGLHGHALASVSVGTLALQSGGVTNRIPTVPTPVFAVKITNGGQNDETNVQIKIRISGPGKPIDLVKTLAKSPKGQDTTVMIPVTQRPPTGQASEIKVTVATVPGETKTDNNTQTYTALFTAG